MKTGSVRTHVFPFACIIYHVTLLLGVSVNQKREKSRKKVFSRTRVGVLSIWPLLKKSSEKRRKVRFSRRFFRISAKIYGRHNQKTSERRPYETTEIGSGQHLGGGPGRRGSFAEKVRKPSCFIRRCKLKSFKMIKLYLTVLS